MKKDDFSMKGYFDTELSAEEAIVSSFIYDLILDYWKENRARPGDYFSNVFAQKVLVASLEELEEFDFVTRGWLHYGKVSAATPENTIEVQNQQNGLIEDEERVKKVVKEKCKDYNPALNQYHWQKKQYEDFNQQFYLNALKFSRNLKNKGELNVIFDSAEQLKQSIPGDKELVDEISGVYLSDYLELAQDVLYRDPESPHIKEVLRERFDEVWQLVGATMFYETVKGESRDKVRKNVKSELDSFERNAEAQNKELFGKLKVMTKLDN